MMVRRLLQDLPRPRAPGLDPPAAERASDHAEAQPCSAQSETSDRTLTISELDRLAELIVGRLRCQPQGSTLHRQAHLSHVTAVNACHAYCWWQRYSHAVVQKASASVFHRLDSMHAHAHRRHHHVSKAALQGS